MAHPLMPKGTAVWLVDNTTLTFKQIAEFSEESRWQQLGAEVLVIANTLDDHLG